MRGKPTTKEERERMVELRNQGMTVAQITKHMSKSPVTIYKILNKVDFTPAKKPNEPIPVLENPTGNVIENFTPLYKGIKYLNEQKKKIDEELRSLKAALQNAIDIIESGDTAQPERPTWGVLNHDRSTDNQ